MTTIIDYLSFPHIFATVVEYCNEETLKCLRTLSSAAKLEVDRHNCRCVHYLTTDIQEWRQAEPGPRMRAVCMTWPRRGDFGGSSMSTPLLPWGHGVGCNPKSTILLALWNTRNLSLLQGHAKDFDFALRHLSPRCTSLILRHVHCHKYKGCKRFVIPPSIRHLRLLIPSPSASPCPGSIQHSCPELTLAVDHDGDNTDTVCRLAIDTLRPCVRRLDLEVVQLSTVAPYLRAAKRRELYPELRIMVWYICDASDGEVEVLRRTWKEIIDVDIQVQRTWWREHV